MCNIYPSLELFFFIFSNRTPGLKKKHEYYESLLLYEQGFTTIYFSKIFIIIYNLYTLPLYFLDSKSKDRSRKEDSKRVDKKRSRTPSKERSSKESSLKKRSKTVCP